MTTETERTPEQQAADLIRSRFEELAPNPREDTPDHSLATAKLVAVDAQRGWHRLMTTPVFRPEWDDGAKRLWVSETHATSLGFAVTHLLLALRRLSPEAADEASRQIAGAWDFGESVGEWLRLHCRELGIDTERVGELEDAWQALPESRQSGTD